MEVYFLGHVPFEGGVMELWAVFVNKKIYEI